VGQNISKTNQLANSDILFAKGVDLYKAGKYKEAISIFTESDKIDKKILESSSNRRNYSSMWVGSCYYKLGDTIIAKKWSDNFYRFEPVDRRLTIKSDSLSAIGNKYYQRKDYTNTLLYYIQCGDIEKKVVGENHIWYANTLQEIGNCYYYNSEYSKAINYYSQALNVDSCLHEINSARYATSLNNLAFLYNSMGNYAKAKPLYLEALKIKKTVLGENHPNYAISLNNLATIFAAMGNYAQAEPLYLEVLKINKTVFSENYPHYATSLSSLATLYADMGNYAKAEPLYLEALKICKTVLGENHPDYASSLNNLAGLYYAMGNYAKAKPLYLEALKIRKTVIGENHPKYAISLNNLAGLYKDMGNYAKAELLNLEALKIRKTVLGENHPDYASSLNTLAGLYKSMRNYAKAEPLLVEGLKIRKTVLGENHPDYASSLHNLATIYQDMRIYAKAEPLYLEALKICKTVLGENHPDYATSIDNLAGLYYAMGNYAKAQPLYLEALKIRKTVLGENHPQYAISLNNLAGLYKSMGNYAQAEPIYLVALKINKIVFGENHPDYATSLNNLAGLYNLMGINTKSEPLFLESYSVLVRNTQTDFTFLSEKERELYWNHEKHLFDNYYPSFTYNYCPQKPSISTFAYNNALFTKGLLLNTSVQIQNAILQSGDSTLKDSWNIMRSLRQQIKMLESKPLSEQIGLQTLENQADSIDKVLTKKSQLYKQSLTDMQQQWTDVQNNLQPNEAAIEFISFNYFNKHYTDSTMYCALVLKKDSKYPEMIPLFEEKQLDSLFVRSSSDVNQLYTYRVTNLRKDIAERTLNYGSKLYNLLWKPLEASLKNTKTVYYSPSGKLNQVAFAAIPVDSTFLLSDKYNLHQVTSTRQVIKKDDAPVKVHDAALFGGIQYELDNKQLAQVQTTTTTVYRSAFVSDSTQRSSSFGFLKGTGEEVTGIAEEFKKKGLTDQLFTGVVASEAAFKKLSGTNTDIIHIATHGFYLPIEKTKQEDFRFMGLDNERRNVVYHNPLLRSGLVFAGANRAWRGDTIPDNWEDGILTAHEISQINLTHTDLVVLSACETALGDVKGSEGVFGLQRAFKMAGVQTLIMSLWKVPDTQTSQLMQGFYKYWLSGMSKHNAFTKAQNEVRKANPNPYYWAAFVMVD
jgi:tetratricopeptide (TPR) repeat protein